MPRLTRRTLAGAMLAMPFLGRAALAQGFPARPIRMVVPYPPGGGADTTARLLAEPMGAMLGQPVVVENRGGAGGSIGAGEVARAAADGHTLLLDAGAHVVNPAVLKGLSFDYARAFAPISQVTVLPQILLVKAALPARTVAEFIALAKARPDTLTYGSSGNATSSHLAAALFAQRAGISLVHVPYRGGGPAVQDLVAGNIDMHMGTVSSSLALARDGRIRALAVTHGARLPSLPDVPTIAESGFPGYELNEWNGLYAPAGTPDAVLDRIHAAAMHALAQPAVTARLDALGAMAVGSLRADFAGFVTALRETMAKLVVDAKITVD
ncbi:tripartite tricarboxylate transporter substrate binding protein [Elioraea sp.]|uniref:Bug family tripartite tricarboxylate transporter substrate binding protein n=1 Tax=Elioraea sp. TaxID=2185103 RepID=UPI0025C32735|nr:tripartite tricarboxylate transporter substrate binding protein [Elioraea sp.]